MSKTIRNLIIIFIVIAVIIAIIASNTGEKNTGSPRGKDITAGTFSESMVKGYKTVDSFSECFYSTKTDRGVIDGIRAYNRYSKFSNYYNRHKDIDLVFPENWDENTAESKIKDGYYALIVSLKDMQDPKYTVSSSGAYYDKNKHDLVIAFSAAKRNPGFEYSKDPEEKCRQIYTVVYIDSDTYNGAKTIKLTERK